MTAAGPGQRRLNGPQTTGREYRNLSEAAHAAVRDDDVPVPLRDGGRLRADVHRPDAGGQFPALVAASPYPRQIQDLGAPMGFIEAGASDFFVPRGYVHVIANLRGTGGSDGTFTLFDHAERRDLHDLVEWTAAQPWCDGNVGMVGISYFAMTQLAAATQRPPHLKAIFPVATTPDLYEAVHHHGLFSATFISPWLATLGVTARQRDDLWRGTAIYAARRVLSVPRVHERFEHMNGESAVAVLRNVMRIRYDPHPWDDLWQAAAVEHPLRDAFWDERSVLEDLAGVDIPVYLGCDWENVPLHLPGTFSAWESLAGHAPVRMGMLPEFGLTWPWESLHVEALAWFDQWLKGRETGILDGPPIRYWMPGADEWRTADAWPPPEARHVELALGAGGTLGGPDDEPGARDYLVLGPGLGRPKNANPPALPSSLSWETAPLGGPVDVVGEIELCLDAASSAADTGWIVLLQDVAPDGTAADVTAGWLRASLRAVDEAASRPGAPVLRCRTAKAVPAGDVVAYRIPLVPNARRFAAGHRIRLLLTSDDSASDAPAIMGFRHTPVGTTARNTVHASSRLLLPVTGGLEAPEGG
jgi:uncharacterized protein